MSKIVIIFVIILLLAGLCWHLIAGVELKKTIVKLEQTKEREYQQRISGQREQVRKRVYNKYKEIISSYEDIAKELEEEGKNQKDLEKDKGGE